MPPIRRSGARSTGSPFLRSTVPEAHRMPAVTHHRIHAGYDLPLDGAATGPIRSVTVARCAVLPDDYPGLRPRPLVAIGDRVRAGQAILEDRGLASITVPAPVSGTVEAVARGARRALQAIVINHDASIEDPWATGRPIEQRADAIRTALQQSGLWAALRQRPFDMLIPADAPLPERIVVTAMDTRPLAADPAVVLADRHEDLRAGLRALSALAPLCCCVATASPLSAVVEDIEGVALHSFDGPHPAGLVGLHLHCIAPVSRSHPAWHCSAQEVAAIGRLCRGLGLESERVLALTGPRAVATGLLRANVGAAIADLLADAQPGADSRVLSGSALDGRAVDDNADTAFLGRYHQQITILDRGTTKGVAGIFDTGAQHPTLLPSLLGWLRRPPRPRLSTALHGQLRNIVPQEVFEQVHPYDDIPVIHLLRALQAGDLDRAEALGALELMPEDCALLSFVDPAKIDHGRALAQLLEAIRKEDD